MRTEWYGSTPTHIHAHTQMGTPRQRASSEFDPSSTFGNRIRGVGRVRTCSSAAVADAWCAVVDSANGVTHKHVSL